METVLIHVRFLSEDFPTLVEYELVDDEVIVSTVRLVRKIVNGGQIYNKPGPVYEAAWIHNQAVNRLLSPSQLARIAQEVRLALYGPHTTIPEADIVHI